MPRALASTIADVLRGRIEAGEWADARLPPERELASDFGVARNTVRRAMTLLKQDGAIAGEVGRGTFVRDRKPAAPGILASMEGASPADVMEVRLMLEPSAAASAALNASAPDLAAIDDAHAQAKVALDMPGFEQWDAEFHHRIVACSRNELLKALHLLLKGLRNQAPWFEMKQRSFSEQRRQHYCAEHASILAALVRRDPVGSRDAMAAHLTTVRINMMGR